MIRGLRGAHAAVLGSVLSFAVVLPAMAEEVLTVEAVSGHASVERVGVRSDLKPGDSLSERDLVRTMSDSRMSLRFPHNGFAELGPQTTVAVEKLPFASYATDLKSIFTLAQGYMRLVWKRPAESANWPLYVFFGGQRAAVSSGEFFFDARPGSARVCVAAGQVTAVPIGGASSESLKAPACYRLAAGRAAEGTPTDPERWIAVRRNFSLDAPSSPEAELAATESAAPAVSAPVSAETESSIAAAAPVAPAPKARGVPPPVGNPSSSAKELSTPPAAASAPAVVAASAAKTATTSVPTSATGPGDWVVNVASYPDEATATTQVEQLRAAGYTVVSRTASVKGRTWYRVQMTNFSTPEAARAKADEVQARLGFKNLWIIRSP